MASHLTVSGSTGGGTGAGRAVNGQAGLGSQAGGERTGAFAALLGLTGATANTAANASNSTHVTAETFAGLTLGTNDGGTNQQGSENPQALVDAADGTVAFATSLAIPAEAKPLLNDLLMRLGDLKDRIENGQPLDPAMLSGLDMGLDALGDVLGIDLTLPDPGQLAALVTAPIAPDAALAARLPGSLAGLASQLLNGDVTGPDQTTALAKTVGEKLAALLGSLGGRTLADVGLAGDTELEPELEAAIAKLLAPPAKLDANVTAPVLAKPALQLAEPVLTGKSDAQPGPASDAGTAKEATLAGKSPAEGQGEAGTGDGRGPDSKPIEGKAAPVVAAEGKPEAAAPGLPQQQSPRPDAVVAPKVVQTGYQTSQQQLNLPQIAFEMARQTTEGNTRFQIRLDPAELGRIDVQLDIDAAGRVNARLVVEKAETLDLMQRDQRGLEKALQQAGLDSARTSLEFSLRQNNGGDGRSQGRNPQGPHGPADTGPGEIADLAPTINLYRASLSASGVNIIA